MTDYYKLTDEEINRLICAKHVPTFKKIYRGILFEKSNGEIAFIPQYCQDDAFCFNLIKIKAIHIAIFDCIWQCRSWQKAKVYPFYAEGKNLNRAILECYLQIVDAEQAAVA